MTHTITRFDINRLIAHGSMMLQTKSIAWIYPRFYALRRIEKIIYVKYIDDGYVDDTWNLHTADIILDYNETRSDDQGDMNTARYIWVHEHLLEPFIINEEPSVARKVRSKKPVIATMVKDLYTKKVPIADIARQLHLSRPTVYKILGIQSVKK